MLTKIQPISKSALIAMAQSKRREEKIKELHVAPLAEERRYLDSAIIVDIDGTLALRGDRSPIDFEKSIDDTVVGPIANILNSIRYGSKAKIILMTSREDCWRDVTAKWLEKEHIPFDLLSMRKTGDGREASLVKEDAWASDIRKRYNISFCIDNDMKVVAMWRSHGLYVLIPDNSRVGL